MTVENTPPGRGAAVPRTVQEYIDETPMWADSTVVRYSPMTNMQWLIWGLAAAGKFFEGMVVFTTGVALPLMARNSDWGRLSARPRRQASPVPSNKKPGAVSGPGIPRNSG